MIRSWPNKFPIEPIKIEPRIKRPTALPDDFLDRVKARTRSIRKPSNAMQLLGLVIACSGALVLFNGNVLSGMTAVWIGLALIGFHL